MTNDDPDAYPIVDLLDGWRFRVEETCVGYWEASGIDGSGRSVSRTGTTNPEILLQECVEDAIDLGR